MTERQWDFLCEYFGDKLDKLMLSSEQQAVIQEVLKAGRPLFENGYQKAYSDEPRNVLFDKVKQMIIEMGGEITLDKGNYRDMGFTLANGKHYSFVLSESKKLNKELGLDKPKP